MAAEKGIPEQLLASGEWRKINEDNLARIHEINQIFIDRGFAAVAARINRDKALYGEASYNYGVECLSNLDKLNEEGGLEDVISQKLNGLEANGSLNPKEHIPFILNHPKLAFFSKESMMLRFFRKTDEFSQLAAPYISLLRDAKLQEEKKLCTLWRDNSPAILFGKDSIPLRKEVLNTVMLDAFAPFGFVKRSMRAGFISIHKQLTPDYAIVIEADKLPLLNDQLEEGGQTADDFFGGSLDWSTYLGAPKASDKTVWVYFTPFFFSYATNGYGDFRTTSEMEVSIRAKALSYELLIEPIAKVIKQNA